MPALPPAIVALAVVSAAWMAALAVLMFLAVRRWLAPEIRDWANPERLVLAGAAVLFGVGIWWGWPGPGWPPDEIQPEMVREALARGFGGGWFDKYPPGFYWLLTLVWAPALVAESAGLIPPDLAATHALLQMQGRVVSLLLSLGSVMAVMVLASRWPGRRHAWPAGLAFACAMPVAFYAKTANVEAAYVCFAAWSVVAFAAWHATGRCRDLVACAVLAALATATKDQAVALYLLPAGYVLLGGRAAPRDVLTAAGAAAAVLVTVHNVPFNSVGFASHVREVLGPASADFREYGLSPGDQAALLAESGRQFAGMLGWPGLVALAVGLAAVWRILPAAPVWLWLPCLSYYLAFIVLAGYTYDRFLMPLLPAAALVMAAGIRPLLDGVGVRSAAVAAGVLVVAAMGARAATLDAMMVLDARYAAERWLAQAVPADAVVAADALPPYLPRLAGLSQAALRPGIDDTEEARPDFIVINERYVERYRDDPVRQEWLAWLAATDGTYVEVFRYKGGEQSPWSWLTALVGPNFDEPYSNLNKINPAVVVYRRQGGRH